MPPRPLCTIVPGGVRITLRVSPGAAHDRITRDANGLLRVRVTAPPDAGKANAAVIKALAKAWRLPRRDISLIQGTTARTKVLEITGDPAALSAHLQAWLSNMSDRP